jgi:hypothetical protein
MRGLWSPGLGGAKTCRVASGWLRVREGGLEEQQGVEHVVDEEAVVDQQGVVEDRLVGVFNVAEKEVSREP